MKNRDCRVPQIFIWIDRKNYLRRRDSIRMKLMREREKLPYYKAKNRISYKKRVDWIEN